MPQLSATNISEVLEAVAAAQPEAPAQVQGARSFSWADLDRRAGSLARYLVSVGMGRQAKVAQYLYNSPEYLESLVGALKGALVPVNTNYRYQDRELLYLWENADVEAVVFHGEFAERIEGLRDRLPMIRAWLWVDDGSGPCPPWAVEYESAVAGEGDVPLPWRRSGDDLILVYTGGTTGMPKGVMWRQDDYFRLYNRDRPDASYRVEEGLAAVLEQKRREGPGKRVLPACPLMHALGLLGGVTTLLNGGCVVTLEGRRFDAASALDTIDRHRVQAAYIVGDAFARPLVQALDAEPDRWTLASLELVRSSGVMWSQEVKRGLLRHKASLILRDGLGSTEAAGVGRSESSGESTSETAAFRAGPHTAVFDDELRRVEPGSGVAGRLAASGPIPIGYYKDPVKTAETFVTVEGERFSIPGDFATVEADGTIRLLGRGSVCINTGGEKVFPEEVEEILKLHPAVEDAACVGVPDERFGEAVTAVVQAAAGTGDDELIAFVKSEIAHYKAPRAIVWVERLGRGANGKLDYKALREHAVEALRSR
jgi:acyl-CoA synthetase (AMP-forming)/AMP-acid ligase II